ncbi:MAG TPA: DUF2344 domain-containing protein [Anaerolineae bacterium]|nr:DUF2344 domain-containing protein [Anaerolineae bacterium]HID84419.1 DUF2344 domain-containing protein [Anaerolineales bacterium]HIQ07996.1 DUF2344 domain-containing protein [Anaerolineaceae bacterium]
MTRLRLTFSKDEAMRFTSHLDVQRTLERTLRRAGVPLQHTQGYHPRPKMHIAAALPLGCTGEAELAEIWLREERSPHEILAALQPVSPPGMHFHHAEIIPPDAPPLPNLVRAAEYRVTFLDPIPDLAERVQHLLSQPSLERIRRTKKGPKPYDLRPLILALEARREPQALDMLLRAEPGATGRPDEVLAALDIPLEIARMHRTRLVLAEGA